MQTSSESALFWMFDQSLVRLVTKCLVTQTQFEARWKMCPTLLQGSFDKIKIAKNWLTRFCVQGRESVNRPVDLAFYKACVGARRVGATWGSCPSPGIWNGWRHLLLRYKTTCTQKFSLAPWALASPAHKTSNKSRQFSLAPWARRKHAILSVPEVFFSCGRPWGQGHALCLCEYCHDTISIGVFQSRMTKHVAFPRNGLFSLQLVHPQARGVLSK